MLSHVSPGYYSRAADARVSDAHTFFSFTSSNQIDKPSHAVNSLGLIDVFMLCYRILSASKRHCSVYQTQSGQHKKMIWWCSFPGMKDGRYWRVLRDTSSRICTSSRVAFGSMGCLLELKMRWVKIAPCWWRRATIGVHFAVSCEKRIRVIAGFLQQNARIAES